MPGWVCLQGGGEFRAACREMDVELLRRAQKGPLVVLAGAASLGRDHDTAAANGARYYTSLGAPDVRVAPDPRASGKSGPTVETLDSAAVVVLPGGSPLRLLTMLRGPVGDALVTAHERGAALIGSSAGAMVLGEWTYLPERRAAERALSVVPGVAVAPHWSGRSGWTDALPAGVVVLGIPESSGLLLGDGPDVVLGAGPVDRVHANGPPPEGDGPS